jgi:hypothetical protein
MINETENDKGPDNATSSDGTPTEPIMEFCNEYIDR